MPAALDGPRLAPRTAPARQLIVFLHGYGADGNDLIELGREWARSLPHAAFVAPNAPDRCAESSARATAFKVFILATERPARCSRGVRIFKNSAGSKGSTIAASRPQIAAALAVESC